MTTAYFTHASGHAHVTPSGHPEQVARLAAIEAALEMPPFAGLQRVEPPEAADVEIRRCHPQSYIDKVVAAIPEGAGWNALDGDTHVCAGSLEAARRGVGGNLRAVDMVMAGEVQNAFVAMRPPGHHAEVHTAMGFCLFGNVAIAAKYALDELHLHRVSIVDFDVHHGNGTQALVWDDERVQFISTHQMPLYPGSGDVTERGAYGQIVNVPLRPGTGSDGFREAIEGSVLPAINRHCPELLLISAGFDAHQADPLAELNLVAADYAWVTERLCDAADRMCEGRVVSTLEGGYDLQALAASVAAHVSVLMKRGER